MAFWSSAEIAQQQATTTSNSATLSAKYGALKATISASVVGSAAIIAQYGALKASISATSGVAVNPEQVFGTSNALILMLGTSNVAQQFVAGSRIQGVTL